MIFRNATAQYLRDKSIEPIICNLFYEKPINQNFGFILVVGTWKKITSVYTVISGVWKNITDINIVISETWKKGA